MVISLRGSYFVLMMSSTMIPSIKGHNSKSEIQRKIASLLFFFLMESIQIPMVNRKPMFQITSGVIKRFLSFE